MKVWGDLQEGKAAVNDKGESLYLQYLLADSELVGLIGEAAIRECFEFSYYTKMWILFLKGCLENKEI